MATDSPSVQLIGFEDSGLPWLFEEFGVFQNYTTELPSHLCEILNRQHAGTAIEAIELRSQPKCSFGGMRSEDNEAVVKVQSAEIPLDLGVTVRVNSARMMLEVRLVFVCAGPAAVPRVTSDMFVVSQRVIS